MRWYQICEISKKYRPSQDEINALPYDHMDSERTSFLQHAHAEEPFRGPHEGRELGLMLAGKKRLALISDQSFPLFEPYIESGKFIWKKFDRDEAAIVGLPGEEALINKVFKIKNETFDEDSGQDYEEWMKKRDAKLGLLLGYTKEHIRKFIGLD